jgi:hypothetical protein
VLSDLHGFKRLGERVMALTFERQVAQVHVRVALLNRFTQLGRPTTVPVVAIAWLRLGLGSSRAAFDLCNKVVPTSIFSVQFGFGIARSFDQDSLPRFSGTQGQCRPHLSA